MVLGMLSCISCGGEEEPQGGGIDKGGSGGTGAQGGTGGMVVIIPCSGCQPMEGCLSVTVTRASDQANQPWKLWPDEADGTGTLVVAATDSTTGSSRRRTVASANMTPTDARYDVSLGCIPVGTKTIGVFLDDNENATASASSSGDYLDSCPMNRSPMATIAENVTTPLGVVLANSCD